MSRPRRSVLIVSLVCAALLTGCTGGRARSAPTTVPGLGTVGPVTWSRQTCRGFDDWLRALDAQSAVAAASIVRSDPPAARAAVVRLFERGTASTDAYLRALRSGGAPAVAHGTEIAAALQRRVELVGRALRVARTEARSLPATDAARLQIRLADLVNAYERRVTAASRTFTGIDRLATDPTLARAFSAACAS